MKDKIYALYFPFQELIKNYYLEHTFFYVWGMANNLQFDKELPDKIPRTQAFQAASDKNIRRIYGVTEWELEFILTEAILYSDNKGSQSVLNPDQLKVLVNTLRDLNDGIDKLILTNKENFFQELFRMEHRQFIWQQDKDMFSMYRYFRMHNHPEVRPIFISYFGMDPVEFYKIAYTLTGFFMNNIIWNGPFISYIETVSDKNLQKFINLYSLEFYQLKEGIKKNKKYDERIFYCYNPLRKTPLVKDVNQIYCPLTTLFYEQITNGIFYHLINANESSYSNAIGRSFEEYTGYIIKKANIPEKFGVYPEFIYNNGMNKSSDWIIEDEDAVVFYECKAKRIQLKSKMELDFEEGIKSDIETISDYIFKIYKTFSHYKNGEYPNFQYRIKKKHYIEILSWEQWYLTINLDLLGKIKEQIRQKLSAVDINPNIIEEVPYFINSISKFERDVQVIHTLGISKYYKEMLDNTILDTAKDIKIRDLTIEDLKADFIDKVIVKTPA